MIMSIVNDGGMMSKKLQLLDCTLRDGCYIVEAKFGEALIKGLLKRLYAAGVDIIECGWLKNEPHAEGSAFFHLPDELEPYLPQEGRNDRQLCLMIDWDRYDLKQLPPFSGQGADTIRMVFPHGKSKEAIALSRKIVSQGYRLFFQAANTLSYSDEELEKLAEQVNDSGAEALSIVDTFGAMYPADLERIHGVLDRRLAPHIKLGFHSHNNQQLSFALSMRFAELNAMSTRQGIIDSSLSGLGRGAGNATTELVSSYLNRCCSSHYDLNEILDAIDTYIEPLKTNFSWGYNTSYFISGYYCCHVNNIAYLKKNHRTLSRDMRLIIGSLSPDERLQYKYDNLERKYLDYSNRTVDDTEARTYIKRQFEGRKLLLLAPGRTLETHQEKIDSFIREERPLVIGINSIPAHYSCDWLFFSKPLRYEYAREKSSETFVKTPKILASNIKTAGDDKEYIVNYNLLIKLGWIFFDDSMIMFLRLLEKLGEQNVYLAGFDGFSLSESYNYADPFLQGELDLQKRKELNADISSMLRDVLDEAGVRLKLTFLTPSVYNSEDKR